MDLNVEELDGRFVLSAQDYTTQWGTYRALVAPLRVELAEEEGCEPRLLATTQQSQERVMSSCRFEGCDPRDQPGKGSPQTNHKNPSFFTSGDELMVLDLLHPTTVAHVTTLTPGPHDSSRTDDFWAADDEPRHCALVDTAPVPTAGALLCINGSKTSLPAAVANRTFAPLVSEAGVFRDQKGHHGDVLLHGGRKLLRIPELDGDLLGVAHMNRGMKHDVRAGFNGDHYSHFFFTISAETPYSLTRVSPEFCFPAADRPDDCDSVQFSSSLLREPDPASGLDHLLIGYGVDDAAAMAVTLPVASALSMLIPLM